MTRLRILGRRVRRSSRRQRIAATLSTVALMAIVATLALGSGASHDPELFAGGGPPTGPEPRPPALSSGGDSAPADAVRRASKPSKRLRGASFSGQTPLAGGVKRGRGLNNLLRDLGVRKPKGRGGVRGAGPGGAVVVGVDSQNAEAANSFFRQYGVDAGAADTAAQARAVADWINANGGVAGRRLELRQRSYDFFRDRVSVLDQQTCELWGGSERVIADVDRHASTDILIPCLAERDVPSVVATQATPAMADFEKWPSHLYAPGSPSMDRPQRAYVQGLRELGFFGRGERVGVVHGVGLPQQDRAYEALRAALEQAGVEVTAEAPVSMEDVASFFLTETQAMLRMRTADVTRIVFLDDTGVVAGQFMRDSEVQGYTPRHGLNSISSPQFVAGNVPERQLRGAVGVGWSPLVDVPASADPGAGPVRTQCDAIFSAAGVAVGGRTPFGQYTAYHACESLLLIAAAVSVSHDASSAGLRAGIERVGDAWQSPLSLESRLDGARHDGATTWRPLRYSSDCGCFRYDGSAQGF